MASTLFHCLLASLIIVTVVHFSTAANTNTLPVAIDKERAALIKDAVEWMNFRRSGQPVDDQELERLFVNPLKEKYVKSKFYRTFVIAFQLGVLPNLILKEGESCDPTYTQEYKDPRNKSVTWHFQKKFTFDLYSKRDSSTLKLCDYRQGLVCSKKTSQCQCPEGSSMSSIDGSSSTRRCLVKQGEICALIDLDHGNDPDHNLLAGNLYHLAFNLEKPLSCEYGTQCRFKSGREQHPECYPVSSGGPWVNGWTLGQGQQCTLGLYANSGLCSPDGGVGVLPRLTCFNYGPPQGNPNDKNAEKIGFCGSYYGSYGITRSAGTANGQYSYNPLLISYVHPRTVPLRDTELKQYYEKFLVDVFHKLTIGNSGYGVTISRDNGTICSVSKTEEFEKEWQYFASLEDPPPPGQDYVPQATKAELDAHLETLADFSRGNNWRKHVCQVYKYYSRFFPDDGLYINPSLKCVQEGTPDGNGNDGKCREPGNLDTEDFAKKLQKSLDDMSLITIALDKEEVNYDNKILEENPEPPCNPDLGPLPKDMARSGVVPTLEGGYCPDDSVCFEDFSDARGIFAQACKLKGDAPQRLVCHDLNQTLDKCEKEHLQKKVNKASDNLDAYAKLKKGDACYSQFETTMRNGNLTAIYELGEYRVLGWLNRGLLCNRKTGNLECVSEQNGATCQCIGGNCPTPKVTTSGAGYTWGKMIRGSGLVCMQFLMMFTVQ